MRMILSLVVALACFAGLSRACDYGCAVQMQFAPVQVQYAMPAVQVQAFAAPVVVQRQFVPSYSVQSFAVQRQAFAPSYGVQSFAVQRSFAAPAVVQQDVSVRRGFGRREVFRSRTVIR